MSKVLSSFCTFCSECKPKKRTCSVQFNSCAIILKLASSGPAPTKARYGKGRLPFDSRQTSAKARSSPSWFFTGRNAATHPKTMASRGRPNSIRRRNFSSACVAGINASTSMPLAIIWMDDCGIPVVLFSITAAGEETAVTAQLIFAAVL